MPANNVHGYPLELCCTNPMTGYFRDGACNTDSTDRGTHIICAEITQEFLTFTKSKGNDLSTPHPDYNFPGLKPGDKWCLCVLRWLEAYENDVAPNIVLKATHEKALEFITMEVLEQYGTTKAK